MVERVAEAIRDPDEGLHEGMWQGSVLTEEGQQMTGQHMSCPVQTLYFLPDDLNDSYSLWDTWIRFTKESAAGSSARKSPTVLFRMLWSVVHSICHV